MKKNRDILLPLALFTLILVVLFASLVVGLWVYRDNSKSLFDLFVTSLPAWFQAIGSIFAIFASVTMVVWQHRQEREQQADSDRQKLRRTYQLLGVLVANAARACASSQQGLLSGEERAWIVRAELLGAIRGKINSIPPLDFPDGGLALMFADLGEKLNAAEMALAALQHTKSEESRKAVKSLLSRVSDRAWEVFYETTRLYSMHSTEQERRDPGQSAFRDEQEAKDFIAKLKKEMSGSSE